MWYKGGGMRGVKMEKVSPDAVRMIFSVMGLADPKNYFFFFPAFAGHWGEDVSSIPR